MTVLENRRQRLSLNNGHCHVTTFVILFLTKVVSVERMADEKKYRSNIRP